jgi:hypothetical protein
VVVAVVVVLVVEMGEEEVVVTVLDVVVVVAAAEVVAVVVEAVLLHDARTRDVTMRHVRNTQIAPLFIQTSYSFLKDFWLNIRLSS